VGRRKRSANDLDGVVVVDKPAGMTSHDVVDRVRRAARQRRVGHTGTLDPDATGVLVCCLGRATRLARFLQAGRKTYAATIRFGVTTSTQDAAGEVLADIDAGHLTEHQVCVAMTRFQGDISQIPPMVSAVKVDGERLHAKARRGEVVDRAPRPVTIHDLVLEDYRPGTHPEADVLVTCSPGTYIRTLAHDLGAALGVGGSLTHLRRLASGGFDVADALTLDDLDQAAADGGIGRLVLPLVTAVRDLPQVTVDDPDVLRRLAHGQFLPAAGHDGPYAVVAGDLLVGVYADHGDQGRPEVVLVQPEDVGTPTGSA
jgi:tRNA pseudouridine55 synthase